MIDAVSADAVSVSGVIKPGHARSRDRQIAKDKGLAVREEGAFARPRVEHRRKTRPLAAAPRLIGIARGDTVGREEALVSHQGVPRRRRRSRPARRLHDSPTGKVMRQARTWPHRPAVGDWDEMLTLGTQRQLRPQSPTLPSNQVHRGERTEQVVTSCACDRGLGEWNGGGQLQGSGASARAADGALAAPPLIALGLR